jgi:hypothetical protein
MTDKSRELALSSEICVNRVCKKFNVWDDDFKQELWLYVCILASRFNAAKHAKFSTYCYKSLELRAMTVLNVKKQKTDKEADYIEVETLKLQSCAPNSNGAGFYTDD